MSDTTTITPEELAEWLKEAQPKSVSHYEPIDFEMDKRIRSLLTALEAAEAENAALKEDLDTTEKSLKEYAGFFQELCGGLKQRLPSQYAYLEDEEYGDDAFSAHDLFDHVIDPVIRDAKEAEAENARLTAERDWLVSWFDAHPCCMDLHCPFGRSLEQCEAREGGMLDSTECWQEAARRSVGGEG